MHDDVCCAFSAQWRYTAAEAGVDVNNQTMAILPHGAALQTIVRQSSVGASVARVNLSQINIFNDLLERDVRRVVAAPLAAGLGANEWRRSRRAARQS